MGLRELLFAVGAAGMLLAGICMVAGSGQILHEERDPDDPGPDWSRLVRWRRWAAFWLIVGVGALAALRFIG